MAVAWQVSLVGTLLLVACGSSVDDPAARPLAPATALPPQLVASSPAVSVQGAAPTTPLTSPPATRVPEGLVDPGRAGPSASPAAEDVVPAPPAGSSGDGAATADSHGFTHAGWFRDPTCRHELRWWSGLRWTGTVTGDGGNTEDPLTGSDALMPPGPGWPVDLCEKQGTMVAEFTLGAEELGCVDPDPACVIDDNGLPRATRLVTYQELVDSRGYRPNLLHDHAPEGLSQEIVLGYLSECLTEWPTFGPQILRYGGTPVQTCSMVWRDMAYPITYLGALDDHRCVWDAYKDFYLRTGQLVAPYIHTGWAEKCASWLDPHPVRQVLGDCRLPDGYYTLLSTDGRFADYGLSLDDPELSPEAVRRRWCGLLARCNDLWLQVAPTRSARFAEAQWPSPCLQRVSGHEINTVRKGRCEDLHILASLVRGEGEDGLPTVPSIPSGLWFSC